MYKPPLLFDNNHEVLDMQIQTIGIPTAMYYFEYGEIWRRFFSALGLRVLLSEKTTAEILDAGTKKASSDLCLPVKAMFGHVDYLLQGDAQPDALFLPKIYKTSVGCYTCPKTIGLTDMLKVTYAKLPTVIEPCFYGDMKNFLISTGRGLGYSRMLSYRAYRIATGKKEVPMYDTHAEGLTVALVGHSYVLGDAYLNMQIKARLHAMRIRCLTSDDMRLPTHANLAAVTGYKQPFWHSADRNLTLVKNVTDHRAADGFIFLNSFGCGTDSLSVGFCRDYIRQHSDIPAITISLDEHSAEAGFVTRLEAFADCLESAACRYSESMVI